MRNDMHVVRLGVLSAALTLGIAWGTPTIARADESVDTPEVVEVTTETTDDELPAVVDETDTTVVDEMAPADEATDDQVADEAAASEDEALDDAGEGLGPDDEALTEPSDDADAVVDDAEDPEATDAAEVAEPAEATADEAAVTTDEQPAAAQQDAPAALGVPTYGTEWVYDSGYYYFYKNGVLQTLWAVTDLAPMGGNTGLQRYWLGTNGRLALSQLVLVGNNAWSYARPEGYVVRGSYAVGDGRIFLADQNGILAHTGWVVSGNYGQGLQRYWIDPTTHAALYTGHYDESLAYTHYTRPEGYVARGKYVDPNSGYVYLANGDGKLENAGWVVTKNYDKNMQRYWIDPTERAAIPGLSTAGYAHYTTPEGYVLRGATTVGGKIYFADNNGLITSGKSGWVVTNIYDGKLQRYFMNVDGNGISYATTGFFKATLGSYGNVWFYGNPATGYVIRGKYASAPGMLLANNDGVLVENTKGAGWMVSKDYDGKLQRYYMIGNGGHLYAKTGVFVVGANHYYSLPKEGYVVRGKYRMGNGMLLADNDGKLAWVNTQGFIVTKAYDGVLQRYFIDDSPGYGLRGAHLGQFTVSGKNYYGRQDTGYVVRGYYVTNDNKLISANGEGVMVKNIEKTAIYRAWKIVETYSSGSKYLLATDVEGCHTYVFERIGGKWTPKFDWLCGTGRPEMNGGQGTLRGVYTIGGGGACYNWQEREDPGFVAGGARTYYYAHDDIYYFSGFVLDCGYHSTIPSWGPAEQQVGVRVSAGCIRLMIENAKWIYEQCPYGTRVIVY